MPDNRFDGKKVSTAWDVVLTHARRMGVKFELDSGRRTIADQWRLVREKGLWSPRNPHGAAKPVPWAPHIRVGRQAHAIDVNDNDGGRGRLQHWLASHGLRTRQTVMGEPWHLEASEGDLKRYAAAVRRRQKEVGHR